MDIACDISKALNNYLNQFFEPIIDARQQTVERTSQDVHLRCTLICEHSILMPSKDIPFYSNFKNTFPSLEVLDFMPKYRA